MRKNFFKKLSFVLALAMIVSVIAPAAGVFAATGLKLNSTNKTLHLSGQPGKNKYNFNIVGEKQKGWKYLWTSSNEDVAEVNAKNGVTVATGIGTAEITVVITDKNGAEVDRLTAKVTVKDNIKTVKIANVPENAIPVGEEYDFNRSFVTLTGVTEKTGKTTSVTRWSVEGDNKDKATINEDNGKFVASEAGKYTVVARAFQSKAKYNLWKETGDESLVLAEDSAEITVKASIKEVKQYDLTKFTVTFDSDMKDAGLKAEAAKLYKVINGKEYESGAEKIKNITLDETGKVATVEMYTDFAQETDYRFKFGDLSGDFKTAKVALEKVTSIEFSDVNVNVSGKETKLLDAVIGKNADGVIIYRGQADPGKASADQQQFGAALSFELASDADLAKTFLDTSNKYLYIYEKGYTVGVTAKFEHYYYNEDTKNIETITWTDSAVATGVETDGILVNSSMQFAVSTYLPQATDGKWGVGPFKLAADDQGYKVYARYKTLDKPDSYQPGEGKFVYESTNTDKLIIQTVVESTAEGSETVTYLYPIAAGSVTVLVRDGDVWNKPVVGAFDIVISEARTIGSVIVESSMVTANNNSTYGTNGTVTKIAVLDSLNEPADPRKINIERWTKINAPNNKMHEEGRIDYEILNDSQNVGKIAVKVDTRGLPDGNYQYKFTVSYKYSWVTKDVVINFNVKDGINNNTVQRWALVLDKSEFDLKNVKEAQSLDIKVYGYNSNNVVVDKLAPDKYDLTIEKNNVGADTKYIDKAAEKFNFVLPAASGGYLDIAETGTYVITVKANDAGKDIVKKASGAIIGRLTFNLKDSSERTFEFNPVVAASSVGQMVRDAFKFYLNGNEVNDDRIVGVKYMTGKEESTDLSATIVEGQSILIKEVYVEGNEGNVVKHTYNVNRTLTAK